MSKTQEALRIALEALEEGNKFCLAIGGETSAVFDSSITAIREALAEQAPCKYPHCPYPCPDLPDCRDAEQTAQQPGLVAWRSWNDHDGYGFWETKQEAEPWCAPDFFAEPLYTSPPAQRKPLTDEEIQEVVTKAVRERKLSWLGFKQDDQGTYNIPVLSLADYQFAHVIEAAHGIKGDA